MGSNYSNGSSPSDPSFFARLNNCSGCQQRKEYVTTMLRSHTFWIGVVVGAGGVYVWHRFKS